MKHSRRRFIPPTQTLSMSAAVLSAALLMLAPLSGCEADKSPSPGMADPYPWPQNSPGVEVLAPELREWLGFQPAIIDPGDEQMPMRVEVPVRNLADRAWTIDYRFIFYDANGNTLEPVMAWKSLRVYRKQTFRVDARAMSPEAKNYKLEIKWAK
jgi:hypothetical protein